MPAWRPTPENLAVLPAPIRRYINDLRTVCDPAGDIQMLHLLGAENRMLRFECERLSKKAGEVPKMKRRTSPDLVPDQPASDTAHMVLDDLGRLGRVWREMDEERTDERDIVHEIFSGEFVRPVKVVAFNLEEGWVRDVTEDIARAVIELARAESATLSRSAAEFVERATREDVPATF